MGRIRLRPVVAGVVLVVCGGARAQQTLVTMGAYQDSAELHDTKTGNAEYYNLALGPVDLRLQAEMGFEFNDNVTISPTDPQADLIFRPGLNMRAFCPVTSQNSLSINLGIGYAYYLKTTRLNSLILTPGSELAFLLRVGDAVLNFHERPALINDVATQAGVAGTGNFLVFQNSAGAAVDWDWRKLFFTVGYDHVLFSTLSSGLSQLDRNSDLMFLRTAYQITPTAKLGFEWGGGLTEYVNPILDNDAELIAGPFFDAQLTDYIKLNASAGLVDNLFSHTGTIGSRPADNCAGYFAEVKVTHRLNQWFDESLQFQHIYQAGYISDLIDLYHVEYDANYLLTQEMKVSAHMVCEHGVTIGGENETFDRYWPGVALSRAVTQKLTAQLEYNFLKRSSNIPLDNYDQSRVLLDLQYSF